MNFKFFEVPPGHLPREVNGELVMVPAEATPLEKVVSNLHWGEDHHWCETHRIISEGLTYALRKTGDLPGLGTREASALMAKRIASEAILPQMLRPKFRTRRLGE
jgi:hypothetical protein